VPAGHRGRRWRFLRPPPGPAKRLIVQLLRIDLVRRRSTLLGSGESFFFFLLQSVGCVSGAVGQRILRRRVSGEALSGSRNGGGVFPSGTATVAGPRKPPVWLVCGDHALADAWGVRHRRMAAYGDCLAGPRNAAGGGGCRSQEPIFNGNLFLRGTIILWARAERPVCRRGATGYSMWSL